MKKIIPILSVIAVVAVIVGICYGVWSFKRTVNYKFYYESSVRQTVKDEVKPLMDRIQRLEQEVSILRTNR